jgi:hypothetical protein
MVFGVKKRGKIQKYIYFIISPSDLSVNPKNIHILIKNPKKCINVWVYDVFLYLFGKLCIFVMVFHIKIYAKIKHFNSF